MYLTKGVNKAIIALLAIAVVALFLYVSFVAGLIRQKATFEVDAANISSAYQSALHVVDGVASSVSALQGGQADTQGAFSNSLIRNYAYINGFGRYASVNSEQLADYTLLQEQVTKNTGPAIWWLDEDENRLTTGLAGTTYESKRFFPVAYSSGTLIGTDSEQSVDGFDLGSIPSLNDAITTATDTARTVITSVPFADGVHKVLALRSTYHSMVPPKTAPERRVLMNGGYFLEIDFSDLGLSGEFVDTLGVRLNLIENDYVFDERVVVFDRPVPESELLFSKWLQANEWLDSFVVGNQTFTIRMSQQRGMTVTAFIGWLALAVVALLAAGIIAVLNAKRLAAVKKQRLQSEKLFQEQQRAAVTLSSIGDAVISTDVEGHVRYINKAAETLLEIKSVAVIGTPIEGIFRVNRADEHANNDRNNSTATENQVVTGDREIYCVNGSKVPVNETTSPVFDSDGTRTGSVVVLRDVTAEKELTRQLEYQINHDTLTGLASRYNFDHELAKLFEDDVAASQSHALCLIDLDRFKQVNDTCGHVAGDQLLLELSEGLASRVREEDLLARLGGDEFAIVIQNCSLKIATGIAHRIHRFFNNYHFDYDNKIFPISGSIGLVHFQPQNFNQKNIVSAADAACYKAKNNGRNCVHVSEESDISKKDSVAEELWVPRIENALEQDRFELYVQPICQLRGGGSEVSKVIGDINRHEFFLRMVDSEDDSIVYYPQQFLKCAERHGLMEKIDKWVVQRCMETIASLPVNYINDIFSINISSVSLHSEAFSSHVGSQLEKYKVSGSRLCFEVTEESVLNNMDASVATLSELSQLGCSVALDDFGSGVSSLSSLRELPLNVLKIDSQYISNLCESTADQNMVRSINSFAQALGLMTVAEHVESEHASDLLSQIGVDYIQGQFIAQPVSAVKYFGKNCSEEAAA